MDNVLNSHRGQNVNDPMQWTEQSAYCRWILWGCCSY